VLTSRRAACRRRVSHRAWKATLVSLAAPASAPPHPTTASHSESELFKARVGLSQARAERNSTSRGVPARNAVSVSLSLSRASPSSVSGVQPPCRRSGIPDAARDDVRDQEAHRDAALKRAATESRRRLALSQRCSRDLDRRSGSPRRSYRRRASPSYFPISRMLRGPADWLAAALDSALTRERESERARERAANTAAVSLGAARGLARFFSPLENCYYTLLKCEGEISVGRIRGEWGKRARVAIACGWKGRFLKVSVWMVS